ncbi:MBL fold metallo-hydrolase [Streptomyces hainanensis]|uniref:MBL fold metallo-hydrolase n=1 Tax=Streptomyces hainanensis TaxID=402648 RepID=A0A4R4TDT9_9ACTN|nr:MBL fold metallo-hydrolase [Streptomyces hainanensis]TDC75661.1 MBL fold metallo-hydrolase [Streptomyces hainanensis]
MTPPLHDGRPAGHLSRRRFGRLTALALGAGAGAGAGSLSLAPAATAVTTDDQTHYDRARQLAGEDPVSLALVRALTPDLEFPLPPAPEPLKLFDNLAIVSVGWVSAMAVLTDDGIVLIDALTSGQQAEDVLVPGLRALGAAPETIRYVVVTHGHNDHYGGAKYLADRYGARVLMTPTDWDLATREDPANVPARDLDIRDGQRLTLGDTTIRLHHTPGHTQGTVSPIIPLRAGAEHHTAMLWGGMNPPTTPTELRTYLASIHGFEARARQADVDVELSNHPNDHSLPRIEQLRNDPEGPNPFVLGRPRVQRFMKVMELMLRGRLADAEATTRDRGLSPHRGAPGQACC